MRRKATISFVTCLMNLSYSSGLGISQSLQQTIDVVAFPPPAMLLFGKEWGRGKCNGGKAVLHCTWELLFQVI